MVILSVDEPRCAMFKSTNLLLALFVSPSKRLAGVCLAGLEPPGLDTDRGRICAPRRSYRATS